MNEQITEYFNEKYKFIKLIQKNEKSKISLVEGIEDKTLYVKKEFTKNNEIYSYLKNIRSKYIPQVFFTVKSEDELWVLEEYAKGLTLRQILETEKSLPQKRVINIIFQLCIALDVLHSNNIIHRDIKPSNIIIDDNENVKLIDFDAARSLKIGNLRDTVYLGTQGYAPPEQYGFSQTDYRADIYSVGVVMKEMLGWDEYKGCLTPVITKCMKVDPLQRYQNILQVKKAVKFSIIRKPLFILIGTVIAVIILFLAKSGFKVEVKLHKQIQPETTTYEEITEETTSQTNVQTTVPQTATQSDIQTTAPQTATQSDVQTTVPQTTAPQTTAPQTTAPEIQNTDTYNSKTANNSGQTLSQKGENYIVNGIKLNKYTTIEMEPNRNHSAYITVQKTDYYTVEDYIIDENNMLWVKVLTGNFVMPDGWVCVDNPIAPR